VEKRAIAYFRVSTVRQVKKDLEPEGLSLPAQREACRRKAESLNASVAAEFVDKGESARSADRHGMIDMLAFLKNTGDIDYVIVPKLDRLARNVADDVTINLAIKGAGAQLVSVSENIDATPSGHLLHSIMAGVAEFYSRNPASETLKGSVQKAKAGSTLMRAPIRYLNVRDNHDGREIRSVMIDPERAPLVQWAFEAYSTGNYSLVGLLDELTVRGLRTKPTTKYPEHPITRSKLHTLLSNPYYIGVITYKGVQYEGRHEPLVSRELFARVQAILKTHARGEKNRTHPHYLRGSIFCSRCGGCPDRRGTSVAV
jgi:site-specific DNA recombinase